ncbi:Cog3 [Gossypium arboreum]|uniref:Cog3 n=1 Tax=Gossypium arboreum TaxID=29729 RepID=A0A0B0PSF0_GOSAR|nr:Cog3 [Gossypium arboreum]
MIAIPQKSFTLLLSISLKTFFHLNSAALNLAFLVSDSPSRDEHGLDPPLQVMSHSLLQYIFGKEMCIFIF